MKKPELLAPVGNMECLKAAIEGGCDAVYLGGHMFGARNYALNFSYEEIKEAIIYAHLYDVKVYVTTNTIVYEDEVDTFMSYVDYLVSCNVDALIMQDLGMIDLVHKTYPDLEIHASTQMHIHNLDGVIMAEKLGIKRVVLARETSIEEISSIKKKTNMPIEVFIHGALCVSYSGQCYMSTLIGNRSGNRGTCAQCCRQFYMLQDDKQIIDEGYLLSTKDLNILENIGDLIDAGVDSLKIEGRMKRKEYVYFVTSLYRYAIDNYISKGQVTIDENSIYELKKLFNRQFTKGFLFHEDNNNFINNYRPNHMGVKVGKVIFKDKKRIKILLDDDVQIGDGFRIIGKKDYGFNLNVFKIDKQIVKHASKGDVITLSIQDDVELGSEVLKTTDSKQLEILNNLINQKKRKILVDAKVILKRKQKPCIIIKCNQNTITYELDSELSLAKKHITTKEDVLKQLNKLGDTVYCYQNLELELDDNLFIPVQLINTLRRDGFKKLDFQRLQRKPLEKQTYQIVVPDFKVENKVSVLVNDLESYSENKINYDSLYVSPFLFKDISDNRKILKLPRVIHHYPSNLDYLMVGEIGGLNCKANVITDFSLNVVNSYAVALLHSLHVSKITLSYELNYQQIKMLIDRYHKRYHKHPNIEVIVQTYPEAIISKYNLYKKYHKQNLYLKDRFNNKYFLKDYGDYMLIYHYKPLILRDNYYNIGVNSVRYDLFSGKMKIQ